MMFAITSVASVVDLNDVIKLLTVNTFAFHVFDKCLVECQDQQHLKLGVAQVLPERTVNVITNRKHAFLQIVGIRRTEVSRCNALCETVMHVVLTPPLRHVDDFTDVNPIARTNLALVNFVQLLLVQKPCQPIHLQQDPLLEDLVHQITRRHHVEISAHSTLDVLVERTDVHHAEHVVTNMYINIIILVIKRCVRCCVGFK